MSNKLTVQVYGTRYPITTVEEPSYVTQLAAEIDKLVTGLMRSNKMSLNEAFVLSMLNYIDLYRKSEQSADNLRKQITEYADELSKARAELSRREKEK